MSTSEKQRESFDIAYVLAKKERPYSDFSELFSLYRTTIKLVPNSLVSSVNQYLMEEQILLLLRKKAFMFCLWNLIRSTQHCHFFI